MDSGLINVSKGKGGADVFWFDRPEPFGKKPAEKALDFDQAQDVIVLVSNRFGGVDEAPDFVSVVRKKTIRRL